MIVPMSRVRIFGPKDRLHPTLAVLQDFGGLHVIPPAEASQVRPLHLEGDEARRDRQLRRARSSIRRALDALDVVGPQPRPGSSPGRSEVAAWVRLARSVGRKARALSERRASLEEERALLARYRPFFSTFEAMSEEAGSWPDVAAYFVVLPDEGEQHLRRLRQGLTEVVGDSFEVWSRSLESGDTGVLILVAESAEEALESLIRSSRLEEVDLPGREEGLTPAESVHRIVRRLDRIPDEVEQVERSARELRSRYGPTLRTAEATVSDELARADVVQRTGETEHAFLVEGWVPESRADELRTRLQRGVGTTIVVEVLEREDWVGEPAPVVLHNPRLFRPFETLVSILPLPRYGSIDPTPFLAIFFPMFFGLVLGDVGYGVLLGVGALLLRRGTAEGSLRRAVSEIAGACAAFTVVFGLLYGELFGDIGASAVGMPALALHREEALVPFLGLALAIGVVHTLLGLVLNVIAKLREGRREALGPGVTLVMVVLVVLALLAAVGVIPRAFFTPFVIVVLALFPVLVVLEGVLGPTELVSTLSHILSYTRVMAVGTASVMMAVAANRMVGAFGSVLVGTLFALLFHLVNFALGIFSPTVHALRLHFVEFFGTFYSPGGARYEPFGHWAQVPDAHPKEEQ